ncbi:MAG: cytochrome c [Thalassovita sp.]|nr:cytochrome c [Thalassovita sp.]
MTKRFSQWVALFSIGIGMAGSAGAAGMSLGEFEYRNSCAQCHGMGATGDGPVTAFLRNMPPDLTMLQKNNDGVFPFANVYAVIDGSAEVDVHGRDMPLWGDRYRERVGNDPEGDFSPADTEIYVRTRILALIDYLAGMQAK